MSEEVCGSSPAPRCLSGIGFTDVEGRIGIRFPTGCSCPVERRVYQRVSLHPYPKELMLRNHV